MNTLPDFTNDGYQVEEQLGYNIEGGRFTYKAINLKTQERVVIKQFGFVNATDWTSFKQIEREIETLRGLKHHRIPRYLNCFDPSDGICLVQEYIKAKSLSIDLAIERNWNARDIQSIGIKVLEILVYLQRRIPVVIHRDIKPENILVDQDLNVYLVDFGFARMGDDTVTALSSMVAGTPGFMPPEQLLNRPLTEASDLYGLGVTLICLLTKTNSTEINNLIDSSFQVNFKSILPPIHLEFVEWLEKMVQPNLNDRFENAEAALNALKSLKVIPEVKLVSEIDFGNVQWGSKVTKELTIEIDKLDSQQVIESRLEVAPHLSDPPHTPDSHAWISISPVSSWIDHKNIKKELYEITVDTSKLVTNQVFERSISWCTNPTSGNHNLKLKIQANKNVKFSSSSYKILFLIWFSCCFVSVIVSLLGLKWFTIITVAGAIVSYIKLSHQKEQLKDDQTGQYNEINSSNSNSMKTIWYCLGSFLIILIPWLLLIIVPIFMIYILIYLLSQTSLIYKEIKDLFIKTKQEILTKVPHKSLGIIIVFLVMALGITSGIILELGFVSSNISVTLYLLLGYFGIGLTGILSLVHFKQGKLKSKYNKAKKQKLLIQP